MATTDRESLRQAVSKADGSYVDFSTTTNITTDADIVDSKLEAIGFHTDSSLVEAWVWLDTTANPLVERTVESNTGSTGSMTVRGANLGSESGSVSGELHRRFRPSDIHDALEHAINTEYNYVFNEIVDITLHTTRHQLVYDLPSGIQSVVKVLLEDRFSPEFEENILWEEGYSVEFDGWDVSTKPNGSDAPTNITLSQYGGTPQQEQFTIFDDDWCKAVSNSSAGTHYWTTISTPSDYGGITLTYEEPIYCTTADEVKVTIVDDQGSTASAFHGGTGLEFLRVAHSVTDSPTSLTCGITTVGASVAFYRGRAILTRAETPVQREGIQINDWELFDGQIRFRTEPMLDRALILKGKRPLTSLTSDSSTIEIGEPQVKIIVRAALVYLYENLRQKYTHMEANPFNEDVIFQRARLNEMKSAHGMPTLPTSSGAQLRY